MLSACLSRGRDLRKHNGAAEEVRGSHSLPAPYSQGPPHAHNPSSLSPREWIIFISS